MSHWWVTNGFNWRNIDVFVCLSCVSGWTEVTCKGVKIWYDDYSRVNSDEPQLDNSLRLINHLKIRDFFVYYDNKIIIIIPLYILLVRPNLILVFNLCSTHINVFWLEWLSGLKTALAGHFQDSWRTLIFHSIHFRDTPITVKLHSLVTLAHDIHTLVLPGSHVQQFCPVNVWWWKHASMQSTWHSFNLFGKVPLNPNRFNKIDIIHSVACHQAVFSWVRILGLCEQKNA